MSAPLMIMPPQSEASKLAAERARLKKGSYADVPGTGPKGETCGSCKHLFRNELARTYLKCGLCRQWWTGGASTDVLSRAPACSKWEARS